MPNKRAAYPGTISNNDGTRYYLSRNETYSREESNKPLTVELRDTIEDSIEKGFFILVLVRKITNWKTGDYFEPFIVDVLYDETDFTKTMFDEAINFSSENNDSMDFIEPVILHKDEELLSREWDKHFFMKKEEEERQAARGWDEFGYPY